MSIEYNAYESALEPLHQAEKIFIGRDALLAYKEKGLAWNFATLAVHGTTDVDARGSEAIYDESGALVAARPMAPMAGASGSRSRLAMLKPGHAEIGTKLKIKILGELYDATVIPESPFDPENAALRA